MLYGIFRKNGLTFFCGVPDSTFKDWMKFLADGRGPENIVTVNECEAVALCAGYHLGTGKIGVAYMQNAGEGHTVNPIASLCDPEVYSIPLLLMIGWRGEPGKPDEPQHRKMGKITLPLLDVLGIPYSVLEDDPRKIERELGKAVDYMKKKNAPYAIVIRKGLVQEYGQKKEAVQSCEMLREDAIKAIVDSLKPEDVVVSTTGKTSRELFEYRDCKKQGHQRDFYTVGSMGCAAPIALGIAMQNKRKRVFIFDGDGAVLMHMGTLATIGHYAPKNLYHIVFDNESHESTGGQPTVSPTVDFAKVALACGYKKAHEVKAENELEMKFKDMIKHDGPSMLVVKVRKGSRPDLGRPTTTPIENKSALMKFLSRK